MLNKFIGWGTENDLKTFFSRCIKLIGYLICNISGFTQDWVVSYIILSTVFTETGLVA